MRSLVGCSPWGHRESNTTERLSTSQQTTLRGEGRPLYAHCLVHSVSLPIWATATWNKGGTLTQPGPSETTRHSRSFWTADIRIYNPDSVGHPYSPLQTGESSGHMEEEDKAAEQQRAEKRWRAFCPVSRARSDVREPGPGLEPGPTWGSVGLGGKADVDSSLAIWKSTSLCIPPLLGRQWLLWLLALESITRWAENCDKSNDFKARHMYDLLFIGGMEGGPTVVFLLMQQTWGLAGRILGCSAWPSSWYMVFSLSIPCIAMWREQRRGREMQKRDTDPQTTIISVVTNTGKHIQALEPLEASSKDTRNKHSSLNGPSIKSRKHCVDGIRKIWDMRERERESSSSSYKVTNHTGLGPHPYDLI